MPTVDVKNMKTLGAIIKASRKSAGIPVGDFAEEANVTPQYLWQIETGKQNLFHVRLFRILRKLGITLSVTFNSDRRSDDD